MLRLKKPGTVVKKGSLTMVSWEGQPQFLYADICLMACPVHALIREPHHDVEEQDPVLDSPWSRPMSALRPG